jgi:hypothetical protein
VSVPVPHNIRKDLPAFDAWVEFVGYLKESCRAYLPGFPEAVVEGNIYHCQNRAELINEVSQRLATIGLQGGIVAFKVLSEKKVMTPEELVDPSYRYFVPLDHIKYIETRITPMTELPRVEEPGVPLTGQGLETVEHKPS